MTLRKDIKSALLLGLFILLGGKLFAQFYPSKTLGPIFIKVQMDTSILCKDNKSFVDYIPKKDVNQLIKEFNKIDQNNPKEVNYFIDENFYLPPINSKTANLEADPTVNLDEHLNLLWDLLKREKDKPLKNSSLVCLPNQYIVPGGRFREIYYWDSYFTMLGLQVSGREDIINDMIDNFKFLIDSLGFIPNGNRTYFLSRSQPPFFSLMIALKAEFSEENVYKEYLPQLLKEYNFWMKADKAKLENERCDKHVVLLSDGSVMNRYWDNLPEPRPEAYRNDMIEYQKTDRDSIVFFHDIRAACESGWDFSSRWLKDGINLHSINTTEIIPVDLNSLMYHLEKTIAEGYLQSKNHKEADKYFQLAERRKKAIIKYCWSDNYNFFMDYNFLMKENTKVLSLAGMYPLFFNIANNQQAKSVAKIIKDHFAFSGGLVSTLNLTGQQWDAPNGWAPLQYMSIKGLYNYQFNDLANDIKTKWLKCNEEVYSRTGKMMEKYDVINTNRKAGGGEYQTPDGFGWTNGVYLKLSKMTK